MTFLSRLDKVGLVKETVPGTYQVPGISVPWNTGKWLDIIDPLRDESIRANDDVLQGISQGPAHSTWEMETNFYADLAGHFFRGIIGPDTVSAGVSTTLASNASAGATTLSLTATVPNNSVIQISDSGGTNLEWVQVGTVTGGGPATAPITSPATGTRFAHTAAGGSVLSQSTHTFAQLRTFSTVWPTYSLTLDDGQEQLGFPGCVMSELTVKIDPKGFVTLGPKWTGFPSATQSTFAYAASLVQPNVGWAWTVANPSASTRGLTMDFTFKRGVEIIQSSDGTQAPREIFPGALELDGQYKAVYDSAADMNNFKQGLQGITTHTVTNPATSGGQSLAITMSKSGYTTGEADSGQPYLQLTQAVSGIANATDSGITTVVLKNFTASAFLRVNAGASRRQSVVTPAIPSTGPALPSVPRSSPRWCARRGSALRRSACLAGRGGHGPRVSVFRSCHHGTQWPCSTLCTVQLRYSYRLYPTPAQREGLARTFGCARVAFNDALAARRAAYEAGQPYITDAQASARLTASKATPERAWLAEVSSAVLQQAVADCSSAYRNFFASVTGKRKGARVAPPRFRSRKDSRQSIRFTANSKFKVLGNGRLRLPKVGDVEIRWSRALPAPPTSVTVIKDPAGRFFASFVVEVGARTAPASGREVGVDLGLAHFAVMNDGAKVAAPRFLRHAERKLKKAQKMLSRRQKGSANRNKARVKVARAHAHVADARRDFHHKLSTSIIRENQAVTVEDLSVKGLARTRLAKSVHDAGWSAFVDMLEYKAKLYGREFRKIGRFEPTSQVCSACGVKDGPKPLSVREWTCKECGTVHDRDVNAARNIAALGRREAQNARGGQVRPAATLAPASEAGSAPCGGIASKEPGHPVLPGTSPMTTTKPIGR